MKAPPLARPGLDDESTLAQMRRVAIAMFIVGGFVCLSGVLITQTTSEGKVGQAMISGLFLIGGLMVAAVRSPSRQWLEAMAVVGVVVISLMIGVLDEFGSATSFYLWPVVYSAYFSSTRVTRRTFGVMCITLAVGLWFNGGVDLKVDTFVGAVATVGVMAVLISAMTRQQNRLQVELAVAAETDPLTGLMNRRSFNPQLDTLVANALARGAPLSIVMFDLDHFKDLNDQYGHLVGDQALQRVAVVLREQSRGGDLVSRFGGEEFAVALPDAGPDDARAYTERVAAALEGLHIADGLELSTSAGICSLGGSAKSADDLLVAADKALYGAKAGGRCRSAIWDGEITVHPRFGEAAAA